METETTRTNDSEEEKDNADTRHPRREYPSRLTLCETLVRGNEEARGACVLCRVVLDALVACVGKTSWDTEMTFTTTKTT